MKIVTLLDNKTEDKKLSSTHGLSLYIEVNNKKILFDLGPNNYYKKNAKKLGIDLTDVDYLIISHGHYDHGTGIKQFLKLNTKAEVFISTYAFDDHIKKNGRKQYDIGIGKAPRSERVHYVDQETLEIFSNVYVTDEVNYKTPIIGEQNLLIYEDGKYIEDHFHHEIYLIVHHKKQTILVSGCSHKGIGNIIADIEKRIKRDITHFVGGLHFSHYDSFNFKETDYLQTLSHTLSTKKNVKVFACHCTGDDAFSELKRSMKDNIELIKTGSSIEI